MGRPGGAVDTAPAQQSSGKRQSHQDGHCKRKKQKLVSIETETRIRVHTLEPKIRTLREYGPRDTRSHVSIHDKSFTKPHCRRTRRRRKWTYSDLDVSDYRDRVVIVSYNILGVENARNHPELYSEVTPKYLDWEYRKKLLCKEVKRYQASVCCFQEVDRFDCLNEILRKEGFSGVYKARGGEAHDGCAIFWKTNLFTMLHEENIEFQRFGLRQYIAQLCVLKMNQDLSSTYDIARSSCATTSSILLVGNIHVLYNPKRGDMKLGQMRIFLEKAYELSQKWGSIPVVLTGDLNSLPQSAMYQYLTSSKLNFKQYDRKHISGQIFPYGYSKSNSCGNHITRWTEEEIMFATGSRLGGNVTHNLKLYSAYAEIPGSSEVRDKTGEPLATSCHSSFTGTVDYIWYTPELVPVRVLETLPTTSLKKTGGLPSKKWGSDHLAIACELTFR